MTPEEKCRQAIEKALRRYHCALAPEVHISAGKVELSVRVVQTPVPGRGGSNGTGNRPGSG